MDKDNLFVFKIESQKERWIGEGDVSVDMESIVLGDIFVSAPEVWIFVSMENVFMSRKMRTKKRNHLKMKYCLGRNCSIRKLIIMQKINKW